MKQKPSVAGPMTHVSHGQTESYSQARDLDHPADRRGSDKALSLPSRMGDKLHYRDGRVVEINKGASK